MANKKAGFVSLYILITMTVLLYVFMHWWEELSLIHNRLIERTHYQYCYRIASCIMHDCVTKKIYRHIYPHSKCTGSVTLHSNTPALYTITIIVSKKDEHYTIAVHVHNHYSSIILKGCIHETINNTTLFDHATISTTL